MWKNSYSENTNQKIWAAKFTARATRISSRSSCRRFKCGHDAPIYTVVEEIVENSGTPYFSFKDIDENKPTGSIKIRTETIGYFLKRYQEDIRREGPKRARVAEKMREYQEELLAKLAAAEAELGSDAKPDVLLEAAGLRPAEVDKRYADIHHGKAVNAAQSVTLNKTAGAHRGAAGGPGSSPSAAPPSAPAAKREDV